MSLSRPLGAAPSNRQREREGVLRKAREVVRARSHGRCQWNGCGRIGTDLAHVFARGHVIGQPLCDIPELCAWLDREHHDLLDGRRRVRNEDEDAAIVLLRWDAAIRAMNRFGYAAPDDDGCHTAVDAVRWLERRLRDTGIIHGREWA